MTSDLAELKRIAEAAAKELPGDWRIDTDESAPSAVAFLDKHAGEERWVAFAHCSGGCLEWVSASAHIATFDPPTCLALTARIEALEAGLRPFGDAAEAGDDGTPDTAPAWESGMAMAVTHGDFRRAANLLGDRHDA